MSSDSGSGKLVITYLLCEYVIIRIRCDLQILYDHVILPRNGKE